MHRFSQTERIGVNRVELIFLNDFEWIPRTIFQTDVGIDMFVEITDNGFPTGQFFGAQIKSGSSYFTECTLDSIIFRTDDTHIDYWLINSLPILIILHNPDDNNTLWQFISDTTAQKTGKSWKIKVPKRQTLTVSFKSILSNLNKLSPVFIKFQKLIFDKNLILKLKAGNKIVIEVSKWINSSTEKADLTLLEIERPDGYEDKQDISWDDYESHLEQCGTELYQFSMNGITNRNSLCHIYPWADFRLDLAFYQNYHESDEIVKDNDWDELTDIPFYCDEEVKVYRYELNLNECGETFIDFFDLFDGIKQFKINFGKIISTHFPQAALPVQAKLTKSSERIFQPASVLRHIDRYVPVMI